MLRGNIASQLTKFFHPRFRQFNSFRSAYYSQASNSEGQSASPTDKETKRCEHCKVTYTDCKSYNKRIYIQEYDLLKENFEKLKQENESLFDKYRRALAEAENSRKRGERQVEEAKIFAIQGFCKDLLEVN